MICHSSKGAASEGYWRWRSIDGRTCWYVGEARVGKSRLTWGETRTPEVVVERRHYTEADLKVKTVPPPPPRYVPGVDLTPQQRIDGAFEALGMAPHSWIEPYTADRPLASAASDAVAVAASSEDGAATVPLRDVREIALTLGIVILGVLLWRGVAATFGAVGRAQ